MIRDAVLFVLPVAVLASMWSAFGWLGRRFGPRLGYFLGFLVYWLGWCLLVPLLLLGASGVRHLFRLGPHPLGQPAWLGLVFLAVPLLLGYGYAFPRAIRGVSVRVVALSAVLALVNAGLEELLWRGTYVATFHSSFPAAVVYPMLGFAIWHIAPQRVHRNRAPGGALSFVLVSAVLGLLWGWVAFSAASIALAAVGHALFDFSGLGGRLYLAPAAPRAPRSTAATPQSPRRRAPSAPPR